MEAAQQRADDDPSEGSAEDSGLTCFHYAAHYNAKDVIRFLCTLPSSQSVFQVRSKRGYSVLHSAALAGSAEVLAELLRDAPAETLNARNKWGETALHLAAQAGSTRCFTLLREANADESIRDNWERTAADVARECFLGRQEAIQKSEVSAAAVKTVRNLARLIEFPLDEESFVALCGSDDVDVGGKDFFGLTALHKVAAWDKPNCVAFLLRLRPNLINVRDAEGCTAAHHTASDRVLKVLVQCGADLSIANKAGQIVTEL